MANPTISSGQMQTKVINQSLTALLLRVLILSGERHNFNASLDLTHNQTVAPWVHQPGVFARKYELRVCVTMSCQNS
jgi:hypothetical protein